MAKLQLACDDFARSVATACEARAMEGPTTRASFLESLAGSRKVSRLPQHQHVRSSEVPTANEKARRPFCGGRTDGSPAAVPTRLSHRSTTHRLIPVFQNFLHGDGLDLLTESRSIKFHKGVMGLISRAADSVCYQDDPKAAVDCA